MFRRSMILFGGAVAAAMFSPIPASAQKGEPIVIGVTYDAAKQASYYSMLQKLSLEALQAEVNAAGGVLGRDIRFTFTDDENNPVTAAQKAEELNAAKAVYIIELGSSSTGLAIQQKAQELGIPNGSPMNTSDRLTGSTTPSFYFRTALRDSTATAAMISFIRAHYPEPKIAIVRDTSETGLVGSDAMSKSFSAAGLPTVVMEQIPLGSSNVTAQALRVKGSGANVVVLASASLPEIASYVKAHRQLGNQALLIGNSVLAVPSFLQLAGPAANGVVFTDEADMTRPDVHALERKLVAAKGEKLTDSVHGIVAWEYGTLVISAIKQAGSTDRAAIRAAMEAMKDHPSLLGPPGTALSFSASSHDAIDRPEQVVLRVIKDGIYTTLKPTN